MYEEAGKENNMKHMEQHTTLATDEPKTGTKPPFKQRVKRHCARFWWLHLLILIVIVLVTVLPVYVFETEYTSTLSSLC